MMEASGHGIGCCYVTRVHLQHLKHPLLDSRASGLHEDKSSDWRKDRQQRENHFVRFVRLRIEETSIYVMNDILHRQEKIFSYAGWSSSLNITFIRIRVLTSDGSMSEIMNSIASNVLKSWLKNNFFSWRRCYKFVDENLHVFYSAGRDKFTIQLYLLCLCFYNVFSWKTQCWSIVIS